LQVISRPLGGNRCKNGWNSQLLQALEPVQAWLCSPLSEHWIGLDNLHYMTSNKKYKLRVVLEDFDGNTVFANYGSFSVGDECSGFQLTVGGFTDGGAGQW
ncbi:unnamed protein product, partial [Tetraodon nigroviridis]